MFLALWVQVFFNGKICWLTLAFVTSLFFSEENKQLNFFKLKVFAFVAGWSSLVARRAHNPKVVGSNPAPATNLL